MWTKPHYRQIRADEVKFGDKIYSPLLGECFCVTSIRETNPIKLALGEGIFEMICFRKSLVWKEVKTKCLR